MVGHWHGHCDRRDGNAPAHEVGAGWRTMARVVAGMGPEGL
ncbi:MAG: hypothetical protein AVDCRST_MAG88-952 [uncultured Thermomicrobiales bacterium]|uniref:Uncharacterized protein n=1 Tax=uncultured Thermomicrobiales bacterium TaxID=1645740 RepID=A0A6J4UNB3_9BACT|nr:MAG: hypothetical protein AVDCRST_MAG88-952 [uncultured Thermomicrobiales bacterium]